MARNNKSKKRKKTVHSLKAIQPDSAGIDLGSREHWVAGPPLEDNTPNVQRFTDMAIIRTIVDGQRDPRTLAQMRDRGCKKSENQIVEGLTGNRRPEHLFNLRQALKMCDQFCQIVT